MGSTALTLYGQPHELLETDFFNIPLSDLQQDLDSLVCNPPYTGGDALPDWYKERINTQLEKTTGLEISARSPLTPTLPLHALSCRRAIVRPSSPLKASSATDTESHSNSSSSTTTQSKPSYNSTRRATVSSITPTTALLTFLKRSPIVRQVARPASFVLTKIESKTIRDAVENGEPGKLSGESSTLSHNPNFALRRTGRPCSTLSRSIRVTSRLLGHSSPSTAGQQQAKSISSACHSRKSMRTISTNATCRGSSVSRSQIDGYDYQEVSKHEKEEAAEDPTRYPECRIRLRLQTGPSRKRQEGKRLRDQSLSGWVLGSAREYLREGVIEYGLSDEHVLEPYWYRPRRKTQLASLFKMRAGISSGSS